MSAVHWVGRNARRVAVLVVGSLVVAAGIALLALPGPGMVTIIVGLVILATEFEWAERLLDIAVEKSAGALTKLSESKSGRLTLAGSGIVMLAGGIAICIVFPRWIVAGISIAFAGVIGLATLHPKVQDWVAEKAVTGLDTTDDVT